MKVLENNSALLINKCEKTNDHQESTPSVCVPKNSGFTPPTPNSKNQLKKQLKNAKYEEKRYERRQQERERRKQQRKDKKSIDNALVPSRKELKRRHLSLEENNENLIRIAIDLDCDNMMNTRDTSKCIKQCLRIYTINRRSLQPARLYLTGIKSNGNIHTALEKNEGWLNWHLTYYFDKNHMELFSKEELIYLTSESDTVLSCLDPQNVYVIGGLVDHNHYKNFSHDRAIANNIRTARLPLSENVEMKTRMVLSTVHVFEILSHVIEGKTWSEAILKAIPARKGAKMKQQMDMVKDGI